MARGVTATRSAGSVRRRPWSDNCWPCKALVRWYGGQHRRIGYVSATGHEYKARAGLVPVRWVFVRDQQGTPRDEYVFTGDPTVVPEQIVQWYTPRWSMETTYQEVRAHLGFGTTRQQVVTAVLRTGP